jgi:hypothetical protein
MDDNSMFSIHSHDRFFKIISIISFFLILSVLTIIVQEGVASSYEFSIYDAYPGYFWILILSAIFCGTVVILGSAITQSRKNYWVFGLCAILISNALLLFTPIIRGYYIYGSGDVLTHIGYMKEILGTFSFGTNHYPVDHILGVIFHVISGLSLPDITLIIPPIFSFFFILSMYFVGRTVFRTKFELLIFVILSTILMWGNGQLAFVPNAQAFFLIPLFLFLAFKMYLGVNANKYHFLLLLISFLIVLYHPLVTVLVILILFFMQIIQYIQKKYEQKVLKKVNYTYTILFIIAVFSIWSTYLRMATEVFEPIISHILGDVKTQSELERNVNLLAQVNPDPVYLIKLILNFYGKTISLGVLALLCIGLICISIKNQKIKPDFYKGFSILGYIVLLMLSIAMLVSNGSFGFGRVYSFASLFSLLIIPTGIYIFLYNTNDRSITGKTIVKLLGVFFIIFCITYFSIFTLFLSPITKTTNQQVPRSDYIGMNTFFLYRDTSLPVLELQTVSNRFYDAIYGPSTPRLNIRYTNPPDHFGSQNASLWGNLSYISKYVLLDDLGREFYPNMYPEFKNNWRFLTQDFERLKSDNKIQHVYSNRNLEVFLISHL